MSGAFQTSRDIFGSPIWKNIVEFRLFFLIYGNAVFAEDGVRLADDLTLKRGEWCRSTRKIQEDLQYIENRQVKTYSTSVINRCIKKLEKMQMICTRTHQLGTVFTVVNYGRYQDLSNYRTANLEHNLEHSGNSVGTVEEHSGNNNNKVKNVNKVNKVKEIKEKDNTFSAYTSNTYLQESLISFIDFRKKIKKPMTEKAISLLMSKLNKLAANDEEKIAILEQSILNGWQGVFELKKVGGEKNVEYGTSSKGIRSGGNTEESGGYPSIIGGRTGWIGNSNKEYDIDMSDLQ